MRKWYEPKKDRPDLTKEAVKKRGMVGFLETLWREFFELIKLNLLFLLTCVPIVTIPAALTALNAITVTMVSDKNHFLWNDYMKAFKRDFVKSLLGGLIYGFALGAFCVSTVFYYRLMGNSKVFVLFASFSACLVLLTLSSSFYFFPMLARVDLPLKPLLKNAVVLTFSCWKRTLLALAWAILLLFVGVGMFPLSTIFLIFLMFSLFSLSTTYVVWPSIKRIVLNEKDEVEVKEQAKAESSQSQELRSASINDIKFDDDEEA